MSISKKTSNSYYPRIFTPSELIAVLDSKGVNIDIENEVSGQNNSLFNTIYVEVVGNNGRVQKVRPRVKFTGLNTIVHVQPFGGDTSRQNRDKIAIKYDLNARYIDKLNNIQEFGLAIQKFEAMLKAKAIEYAKSGKLLASAKGWYGPVKTTREETVGADDEGNPIVKSVELDKPNISANLRFSTKDDNTKGKPSRCEVMNSEGKALTMVNEETGKVFGFDVDTAHHFLCRDSSTTGVIDISTFSRTGQGKGINADIVSNFYVIPGERKSEIHDEDELAQWRLKHASANSQTKADEVASSSKLPDNDSETVTPVSGGLGGFSVISQRLQS